MTVRGVGHIGLHGDRPATRRGLGQHLDEGHAEAGRGSGDDSDLAERAREAELNISAVARSTLEEELSRAATNAWLDEVAKLPPTGVTHEQLISALDAVRDEMSDLVDR